jgi:hypothetical protein
VQIRADVHANSGELLGVGLTASSKEDSPASTPAASALRSMHTGQNSIAPENSLPQLGQVRWGSVLTDLPVLWPQSEPKAAPRSTEWREIVQRHPLADHSESTI